MTDSGVVVRTGPGTFVSFRPDGTKRWQVSPSSTARAKAPGQPQGPDENPVVLPNGLVIVSTPDAIVGIEPVAGGTQWSRSYSSSDP